MTWVERRYHRPDVRHTAGLTYDDIAPTDADDRELKRALRAVNDVYRHMYELGLSSKPCPDDADRWEAEAWRTGRWERNRRRQERVWSWVRRSVRH